MKYLNNNPVLMKGSMRAAKSEFFWRPGFIIPAACNEFAQNTNVTRS